MHNGAEREDVGEGEWPNDDADQHQQHGFSTVQSDGM